MYPLLEVAGLSYSYNGKNNIINNLDFTILKSEIVRISGPNGIGKTTLLKILVGLIGDKKLTYSTTFKGKKIAFSELRSCISFVLDKPQLFHQLSGFDNIRFFELLWNNDPDYHKRALTLCRRFEIEKFLANPVEEYSLGMQHKLFIAVCLARIVDIYIMDEPFNSLDAHSRNALIEWINETKHAAHIIATHSVPENLTFTRIIDM